MHPPAQGRGAGHQGLSESQPPRACPVPSQTGDQSLTENWDLSDGPTWKKTSCSPYHLTPAHFFGLQGGASRGSSNSSFKIRWNATSSSPSEPCKLRQASSSLSPYPFICNMGVTLLPRQSSGGAKEMACTKCLECNGSIIKGGPFPFLLNPAVWVQISTWPLQGCVTLGKLLSHSGQVTQPLCRNSLRDCGQD